MSDITYLKDSTTGSNAQITATLAASAGQLDYLSGFAVNGLGATGASYANIIVSGLSGGSLVWTIMVPVGTGVPCNPILVTLASPIPASAVNTAIIVTVSAFGAGNLLSSVMAWGYSVPSS